MALGGVVAVRGVTSGWAWREELEAETPLGIAWLPDEVGRHRSLILRSAVAHQVDPMLIAIIILVESRGNPAAQSPVGARGLMQVMPATGRFIAKRRDVPFSSANALFDPSVNVDFGTWFLGELLDKFARRDFNQTVELAAGAYNGGPARMRRHLDKGRKLPLETRRYMETVGGLWRERYLDVSPTLGRLWPAKGPSGHA